MELLISEFNEEKSEDSQDDQDYEYEKSDDIHENLTERIEDSGF